MRRKKDKGGNNEEKKIRRIEKQRAVQWRNEETVIETHKQVCEVTT